MAQRKYELAELLDRHSDIKEAVQEACRQHGYSNPSFRKGIHLQTGTDTLIIEADNHLGVELHLEIDPDGLLTDAYLTSPEAFDYSVEVADEIRSEGFPEDAGMEPYFVVVNDNVEGLFGKYKDHDGIDPDYVEPEDANDETEE